MPDDRHLHNAAATLQAILTRRRPEYAWIVEVRPRDRVPSTDASASDTQRPSAKGTEAHEDGCA
jgi:hypothetical protein